MSTAQTDRRQGLVGSVAIKVPVVVATTANITLTGEQTIDGVAVVTGDRVLVKDQATGANNGIYNVDTGDWTRADDFDGPFDCVTGTLVKITSGTTNGGAIGELTTTGTITIGTTALTFAMRTGTLAAISAYASSLLILATAAAWRTALGLGTAALSAATAFATAGAATASGLTMATGKLLGRSTAATGAIEEITVGSGMSLSGGTLSSILRNFKSGCICSNGTDTANDWDIGAGLVADSTNVFMISCAAMAGKQLDANWAPGANAGMRNSGAAITNTTYHIYAVAKADGTQDYYAHTSTVVATVIAALQAESGGSAYIYARRIRSIVRTGGANVQEVQDGSFIQLTAGPTSQVDTTNPGTSAVSAPLPNIPAGIKVRALLNVTAATSSTDASNVLVTDLATTDVAPSATNVTSGAGATVALGTPAGNGVSRAQCTVRTDIASSVRYRCSVSSATFKVGLHMIGYFDDFGRDA